MKKKIVFVHGLARKLPCELLLQNWTKALEVGLCQKLPPETTTMAYWSDCLAAHIPEQPSLQSKEALQSLWRYKKKYGQNFHVGAGEKVGQFFAQKGAELVNILASALTLKDNLLKLFLEEIDGYVSQQALAQKIRDCFIQKVISVWEAGQEVLVIAHSMGSFVAYDALWQLSHRTAFKKYQNNKIAGFFTIGSPLADSAVQDILLSAKYVDEPESYFPSNIERWYNFSCLGDVVSHQSFFVEDYFSPMQKLGYLQEWRDYRNLYNPYVRAGKSNPHKSYGYLVQPKLTKWVNKILLRN